MPALAIALLLAAPQVAITFLHLPQKRAETGAPVTVSGAMYGAADLERAAVLYRHITSEGVAPWKTLELTAKAGDSYAATIPGDDVQPPGIEYYAVASDFFGQDHEIFASKDAPQRVDVGEGAGTRPPPGETPPTRPRKTKAEPPAFREPPETGSLATGRDEPLATAPALVSVVSNAVLRASGARTVADALALVPGVTVSRDVQGFYTAAIHGRRDAAGVLVMFDGHVLNSAYDAKALLELSTDGVERIEVLRGPGPASLAPGATLGAINIVPRRIDGAEVVAALGTFGDAHATIVGGGRVGGGARLDGDVSFGASAGWDRRDITRDVYTDGLRAAGSLGESTPAGQTDDHGTLFNAGARLSTDNGLTASVRALWQDRGALVGQFDAVGAAGGKRSDLAWSVVLADVGWKVDLGGGSSFGVRAWGDDHLVNRLFLVAPPGFTFEQNTWPDGIQRRDQFSLRTAGAEAKTELVLGDHRLAIGVSAELQALADDYVSANINGTQPLTDLEIPGDVKSPTDPSSPLQPFTSRTLVGGWLGDSWRIVPELSVAASLRLDAMPGLALSPTGPAALALDPHASIVFAPADGVALKLLYDSGFRAPTMEELVSVPIFSDKLVHGEAIGSTSLLAERVQSLQAVVELEQALGEGRGRLRLAGFYDAFANPIRAVDQTGKSVPFTNRPQGEIAYGAEAEARFASSKRLWQAAGVGWNVARDNALPSGFDLLPMVPELRAWLALNVPVGGLFDVGVTVDHASVRGNAARSSLEALRSYTLPARTLVGVTLRTTPLDDKYTLELSVQNALQTPWADDAARPDRETGQVPREPIGAWLIARGKY